MSKTGQRKHRGQISSTRTYVFKDKDPIIDEMRTLSQDDGRNMKAICAEAGISTTTTHGWFLGETRRPQNCTIEAFGRALGYHRQWVKDDEKWLRANRNQYDRKIIKARLNGGNGHG